METRENYLRSDEVSDGGSEFGLGPFHAIVYFRIVGEQFIARQRHESTHSASSAQNCLLDRDDAPIFRFERNIAKQRWIGLFFDLVACMHAHGRWIWEAQGLTIPVRNAVVATFSRANSVAPVRKTSSGEAAAEDMVITQSLHFFHCLG